MQIVNANVRGPQEDPNSLARQNLFGAYVGGLQQQRTDDAKMAEQLIKQWDSAWGDKIHLLVGLPDGDPAKTQAITSLDVALQTWNRATGGTKSPAEIAAIRNGFLSSGAPGALTAPQQMDVVNQWGQTPPKEGVGFEPSSSVPSSTTPTTPGASRVDPRAPVSEITLPTIPTPVSPLETSPNVPTGGGDPFFTPKPQDMAKLSNLGTGSPGALVTPATGNNAQNMANFGITEGVRQIASIFQLPIDDPKLEWNLMSAYGDPNADPRITNAARVLIDYRMKELAARGFSSEQIANLAYDMTISPVTRQAAFNLMKGSAQTLPQASAATAPEGRVAPLPPPMAQPSQGIGPAKAMEPNQMPDAVGRRPQNNSATVPGSSAPQAPQGTPQATPFAAPQESFWDMPVPISQEQILSRGLPRTAQLGSSDVSKPQDFSAQGLVNQIKSFELSRGKRLNQLASEGDPTAIGLLGKVVESFAPGANLIEASVGTPFEGLFQNSDFFQPTTPTTPAPTTLPASPETVEIDIQQQLTKNPVAPSAPESHDGSKPFDRLWADVQEVRKAPPAQATGAKFTAAMKKVGEISARVAQGALRAAEKTGEGAGGIWNALGTRAVGSALEVAREAAKISLGITPMTDAEKNALLAKYMKMDEAELALRGFKDAASIKYNRRALAAEIEMNSQRLESSMITAAMKNGGDELEKVNKAAKAENEKKIGAVDTVFKKLKTAGKKDAMTDEDFVLQSGNKDLLLQFQAKHWLETGELLDITGKKFLGGFSGFAPVTDPVKIKEFLTKAGLENYTPNPQLSASVTGMIQAGAQAASGTTPVTTTKIPTDAPVSQASKESWVDSILKK